tara:strand:- start:790 stop:951 length:162 start_codon:yes stop_codon:yes gene_type:complete
MFRPMKPETVIRKAAEHRRNQTEQTANLIARLKEKTLEEGPDSIWAEMLATHL